MLKVLYVIIPLFQPHGGVAQAPARLRDAGMTKKLQLMGKHCVIIIAFHSQTHLFVSLHMIRQSWIYILRTVMLYVCMLYVQNKTHTHTHTQKLSQNQHAFVNILLHI